MSHRTVFAGQQLSGCIGHNRVRLAWFSAAVSPVLARLRRVALAVVLGRRP